MTALRKVLRFACWGVVGLLSFAVLLYLIALGINGRDVPPSAASREFHEIVARRPPVADEANGFVYLLGFTASADQDPQDAGTRRMRWMESLGIEPDAANADPLQAPIDFIADDTAGDRLRNACQEDDKLACAREFDALVASWHPSELDALAMQRYEALLSRDGWREVVPMDLSAPLPAFASAMHAQRLMFVRLAQMAGHVDEAEIRSALAADFMWWKRAQRDADILISKMIALAALRQHFFCSALVLRRLPAQKIAAAAPDEWQEEFSIEDRAMKRVMAGELMYNRRILEQFKAGVSSATDEWLEEYWAENYGVPLLPLARPLFQVQDQSNYFASRFLEYARRYEAPMSEYRAITREMPAEKDRKEFPSRIFNITGDLLLTLGDAGMDPSYALRTASIEAMRRLTLLNVDLHSSAVPADSRGDEVARSTIRNPFDDEPFSWDADRQSVNFEAPDLHPRYGQELFY
jgi:hypothetical protein